MKLNLILILITLAVTASARFAAWPFRAATLSARDTNTQPSRFENHFSRVIKGPPSQRSRPSTTTQHLPFPSCMSTNSNVRWVQTLIDDHGQQVVEDDRTLQALLTFHSNDAHCAYTHGRYVAALKELKSHRFGLLGTAEAFVEKHGMYCAARIAGPGASKSKSLKSVKYGEGAGGGFSDLEPMHKEAWEEFVRSRGYVEKAAKETKEMERVARVVCPALGGWLERKLKLNRGAGRDEL